MKLTEIRAATGVIALSGRSCMKRSVLYLICIYVIFSAAVLRGDKFKEYWYDNKAEITTCKISEMLNRKIISG